MKRAVVFAYHNVGVRCLQVLLSHGVDIPLVVTHADDPGENVWFGSVAGVCSDYGIPTAIVDDANDPAFVSRIRDLAPDFIFSFYYRQLFGAELLATARHGAYNMHGSLLPHYRGRVPVNWAVIRGERQAGATLHEMVLRADAGRTAGQHAVPILPNDTAFDVFGKVTVAAELVLDGALPGLLDGTAVLKEQDLAAGSVFGRRRPEDGLIDWTRSTRDIHNLVRGVAPPYPGAACNSPRGPVGILRTVYRGESGPAGSPQAYVDGGAMKIRCADGGILRLVEARLGDAPLNATNFTTLAGGPVLQLT